MVLSKIFFDNNIQFITESINSRKDLFQIFNAFDTVKEQIILVSDRNPKTITALMEKIPAYFNNALAVEVHQPDLETRLEILTMRANKADVNMNKDAAHWVASNFTENVRELEGALTRLVAHAGLTGQSIDLSIAKRVLD